MKEDEFGGKTNLFSLCTNVLTTYREVMPVEQQFSQQLERLSPSHVVVGMQELLVVAEHFVKVRLQELGSQHFVLRKQFLKISKKCLKRWYFLAMIKSVFNTNLLTLTPN